MSSLARSYQHSRRHVLSHLVHSKPLPIAKRRFRSIASAVEASEYRRAFDPSTTCHVRFVSTTDDSVSNNETLRNETQESKDLPLASLHQADVDEDDGDRLPFEYETDEDDAEQQLEIVAEGMFDITKSSALAALNSYYSN
jgi:hypothetical protein